MDFIVCFRLTKKIYNTLIRHTFLYLPSKNHYFTAHIKVLITILKTSKLYSKQLKRLWGIKPSFVTSDIYWFSWSLYINSNGRYSLWSYSFLWKQLLLFISTEYVNFSLDFCLISTERANFLNGILQIFDAVVQELPKVFQKRTCF